MQRSLQQWQGEPIAVEYRAFFLNPDIPPEGYDFVPYMQAKFKGRISLQQAFDGPRRMGEAAGLIFNMEQIRRAPNTLLSHCLIALAPDEQREQVIEDVYAAYFEHGQDIGDSETLITLGARHGMEESRLREQLAGDTVRRQVELEAREALEIGVNAVPFFVVNQRYAFSGAQPPDAIADILRQVAAREQSA